MIDSTLLFLVKKHKGEISEVLLALKKRSFGVGRWNGVGGKLLPGETIEMAALREAFEEIGVTAQNIKKAAELSFFHIRNSEWNQITHVYITDTWEGEPKESEEVSPRWFTLSKIPYDTMWPDDAFWLPKVLEGKLVKGNFTFDIGDVIKSQKVNVVKSL